MSLDEDLKIMSDIRRRLYAGGEITDSDIKVYCRARFNYYAKKTLNAELSRDYENRKKFYKKHRESWWLK